MDQPQTLHCFIVLLLPRDLSRLLARDGKTGMQPDSEYRVLRLFVLRRRDTEAYVTGLGELLISIRAPGALAPVARRAREDL